MGINMARAGSPRDCGINVGWKAASCLSVCAPLWCGTASTIKDVFSVKGSLPHQLSGHVLHGVSSWSWMECKAATAMNVVPYVSPTA
eukprot:1159328-Pelagomonas_calceolata.AAC.6